MGRPVNVEYYAEGHGLDYTDELYVREVAQWALELERALEFYAKESNWRSPSTGFALQYDPEPAPAADHGRRAREALGSNPVAAREPQG